MKNVRELVLFNPSTFVYREGLSPYWEKFFLSTFTEKVEPKQIHEEILHLVKMDLIFNYKLR